MSFLMLYERHLKEGDFRVQSMFGGQYETYR